MDDLLAAVIDRKRDCQEKKWTVERGRERNAIVLRDVFTKIATWVEKFVECGDCAVQYDPGHAALPWAAVRFLLKVETYGENYEVSVPNVTGHRSPSRTCSNTLSSSKVLRGSPI